MAVRLSPLSEKQLLAAITEQARLLGWRHYHTHDSRHSAAGFPDLVLLRPPRLVFAELKVGKKEPTQEQALWLNGLSTVPGVEQYVWRDEDWLIGRVDEVLR